MRLSAVSAMAVALLASACALTLTLEQSASQAGASHEARPATPASVIVADEHTVVRTVETSQPNRLDVTAPIAAAAMPTSTASATPTVQRAAEPAGTLSNTTQPPLVIVRVQVANVRAGPGTVYPVIGSLRSGESRLVSGRDASESWWQIQYGGRLAWISGQVVIAPAVTGGIPVVAQVPPTPAIAVGVPRATGTPTAKVAPLEQATVAPTPSLAANTGQLAIADTIILGSDTRYPVRARRVVGWGYEIVDGSQAWDVVVNRDTFGVMAHQFWAETLYRRHQQGIRITIIDAVTPPECVNSAYPQYSPVLAPIPLANWSSGCKDRSLPLGFGDGEGASIAVGCARDKPGAAITVQTDPEECFIAIRSPGPHLNDIVVTGSVVAYNLVLNTFGTETPDLAQPPFTPALGRAYKEGDQWRWDDPFITIVPSAQSTVAMHMNP